MKDTGIWYDSDVNIGSAQFRLGDRSRLIYYFRDGRVSFSTVGCDMFWNRVSKRQVAHVELVAW